VIFTNPYNRGWSYHRYMKETTMNLDEYSKWTRTIWVTTTEKGFEHGGERSLILIGLGLGGELCEAITTGCSWADGKATSDDVQKELGDWVYYWARLCDALGVLPSAILETVPAVLLDKDDAGLAWIKYTGIVVERTKKFYRDGRAMVEGPDDSIFQALQYAYLGWSQACDEVAGGAEAVWMANVAKLESRKARGVLRGSGDNR
jgi:hypothetical protein